MKRSLPGLLVIIAFLLCCGCRTIKTQKIALRDLRTREDVIQKFGPPDKVKPGDGWDEWIYYDRDYVTSVDGASSSRQISSDSLKAGQSSLPKNYIQFIIDTGNNVTGYKNNGVNLTESKRESFGKGLVNALAVTGVVILVVGLEIANNGDFEW